MVFCRATLLCLAGMVVVLSPSHHSSPSICQSQRQRRVRRWQGIAGAL
jgi:hypothetical protein